MNLFNILEKILVLPFKLLWAIGYVWGHSSEAQKREYRSAFWWSIIIFVAPIMMLWDSCQWRPVVRKRNALIEVNCKGAKSFSNKEVEETYQYGLEQGWFDNHPELKKY